MAALDLTDLSHLLAHKWYRDELGRIPTITQHGNLAKRIREQGAFAAFTSIYDSPEAKVYRDRVGRKV
jgi:hypothetical protein